MLRTIATLVAAAGIAAAVSIAPAQAARFCILTLCIGSDTPPPPPATVICSWFPTIC